MEAPAQAPPGDPVAAGADLVPLHPRVRRLWWLRSALTVLWMTIVAGVVDWLAPIPLPPWSLPGLDVDEAERLRERLAQVEDDGSAV